MPALPAGYRVGAAPQSGVHWRLKRNCSITPLQLGCMWGGLVAVSLAVAGFFWSQGAVLVLPFTVIEVVALTAAFVVYARHAADAEVISLNGSRLEVEVEFGGRIQRAAFAREWVRVEAQANRAALIELSGQGQSVLVGRHIRPDSRVLLAGEIRRALRGV